MKYKRLSNRQKLAMLWWNTEKFKDRDGIICDGSIRSGKTVSMTVGFVLWAMCCFSGQTFSLCGKTIESLRRNIIVHMRDWIPGELQITERRADNKLIISDGCGHENTFYLFGGRDESSYTLVQGITLAGALLDEVALMPRSFVEQVIGRCSVAGSKIWFNCNPEGPEHWFYKEWVLKFRDKNVLHLHFTMDDNLSLEDSIRARYKAMFSGVFYERFVLGRWVMSEGLIYDMFDSDVNTYTDAQAPASLHFSGVRTITCDYGTTNPTVFLDIYDYDGTVYVDREYRWDSREEHRQKTDEEYADDMVDFIHGDQCAIIVDPSAASFIAALRRRGLYVILADNDVLDGIRRTATLIQSRRLLINRTKCAPLLGEMGTYLWDEKSCKMGVDKPLKERDHGPDALRYFVNALPDWRFDVVQKK